LNKRNAIISENKNVQILLESSLPTKNESTKKYDLNRYDLCFSDQNEPGLSREQLGLSEKESDQDCLLRKIYHRKGHIVNLFYKNAVKI
jgi:hypothetical protein